MENGGANYVLIQIHAKAPRRKTMDWTKIKDKGNPLYKGNDVEPVDLFKSGGLLRDFAIGSIIKYAFRNRSSTGRELLIQDMDKIIHYAEMLKALGSKNEDK